jgi:hypothetical protein
MTVLRKISQSLFVLFISFYSIGIMQSNWLTWGGDNQRIPYVASLIFACFFLMVVMLNIAIMFFEFSNTFFLKTVGFLNLSLLAPISYLIFIYVFHYQYWHDDEISSVGFPIVLFFGLSTFIWILSNGFFLKRSRIFFEVQSNFLTVFIYVLNIIIVIMLFYLLLFSSFSLR